MDKLLHESCTNPPPPRTFDEKFSAILSSFPRLDDVHPFHKDLLNTLYDKDHFKIALGQISTAKHLMESIARDYVRLLKYGQSLFQCKQLKRAGLGRMATLIKRLKEPLLYLDQVRQQYVVVFCRFSLSSYWAVPHTNATKSWPSSLY